MIRLNPVASVGRGDVTPRGFQDELKLDAVKDSDVIGTLVRAVDRGPRANRSEPLLAMLLLTLEMAPSLKRGLGS